MHGDRHRSVAGGRGDRAPGQAVEGAVDRARDHVAHGGVGHDGREVELAVDHLEVAHDLELVGRARGPSVGEVGDLGEGRARAAEETERAGQGVVRARSPDLVAEGDGLVDLAAGEGRCVLRPGHGVRGQLADGRVWALAGVVAGEGVDVVVERDHRDRGQGVVEGDGVVALGVADEDFALAALHEEGLAGPNEDVPAGLGEGRD